jgi:hypothetical protein
VNASAYINLKWNDLQPFFWGFDDLFLWVPPHFRILNFNHDEFNRRQLSFLIESSQFFADLHAPTLNVFSMTRGAAPFFCRGNNGTYMRRDTCEKTLETYDGVHWSRGINLWKAHLILEHLKRVGAEKVWTGVGSFGVQ